MIEIKFQFKDIEEALLFMSELDEGKVEYKAPVAPAAPPAAPRRTSAAPPVVLPAAPAAPPAAPAAPPAAPAAPAAPPAAPAAAPPISAEQLQTLMQQTSARLSDGGAACMAVIQGLGVTGIATMTDEQRAQAAAKVNAL